MAQSISLFRKYLWMKAQRNLHKANKEGELEPMKTPPNFHPLLLPPKFDDGFRPPSLLEKQLFPALKLGEVSCGDKSSKSQLTIFYSGAMTVYEEVPLEKAQAIILLAGESSLTTPIVKGKEMDNPKSNLPSICKFRADLPIARKYSLQRFLEKRRDRIMHKSPYALPTCSNKESHEE